MNGIVASQAKPHMVISPPMGWASVNFRELWRSRDLLISLGVRDIKLRYRQTALGVAWVILQPLMAAAIFAFVFGKVARFGSPGGVPYFLFAFTGMVCWNVFSGTLNRTTGSMVGNAHLVSKVYFPRIVLPLSGTFSTLIDLGVTLALLAVMIGVRWHFPGINFVLMPVCVLLMLTLALGMGLCAAALAVSYRDVQFIVPVMTQLLLYASPVAYPVEKVPDAYRAVYFLNPFASILEAFRWSLLSEGELHWGYLGYAACLAFGSLVVGSYAFTRMERKFADVI